jgi:hypothetical protein
MITYPILFFSYCPLLFSAISIHIGFKSVITSANSFHDPKDVLKLNYFDVLHILSSNEQTHSAGVAMLTWLLILHSDIEYFNDKIKDL